MPDMLLIIDPQRKFIAPPTRTAMRAAAEAFGAKVPLLSECAKIAEVVDNLHRSIESLRPYMEIAWAAMMNGETGIPRAMDNPEAFKKMVQREEDPDLDFHDLEPLPGEFIFTKYEDSVFSNRTFGQILKVSPPNRLLLAGFNNFECILRTYKSQEAHDLRANGTEMAVVRDLSGNSYKYKGTFRSVVPDEQIMQEYERLNINVVESGDVIRAYQRGAPLRVSVPQMTHGF